MSDPDVGPFGEVRLKLKKHAEKIRSYIETEKAIRAGEELWNQSPDELTKRKLLGPWGFMAAGTLYGGFVVNIFEKTLGAFLKEPPHLTWFASLKKKPFFEAWFAINDYTIWFLFALQTTLLVAIISRGVLWSEDSIRERRQRTARAFLYLDGAKNTHKQVVAGVLLSVYAFLSDSTNPLVIWILCVALLLMVWAIYTVLVTTTKSLFRINGYSCRLRFFWQKPRVNDPPWTKFIILNWITPFIGIVVALLYLVAVSILATIYILLKTGALPN